MKYGIGTTYVLNKFQDAGIPARQIAQIMRPAIADKSSEARSGTSKDTESNVDKKVIFGEKRKPLSEVGEK